MASFVSEVVKEPAVLVGNSLGGIVSLQAAAVHPPNVLGLVLINVPGNFGEALAAARLSALAASLAAMRSRTRRC